MADERRYYNVRIRTRMSLRKRIRVARGVPPGRKIRIDETVLGSSVHLNGQMDKCTVRYLYTFYESLHKTTVKATRDITIKPE